MASIWFLFTQLLLVNLLQTRKYECLIVVVDDDDDDDDDDNVVNVVVVVKS